jgi:hypothetical protein
VLSTETHLAFAPAATYAVLLAQPPVPLWRRLGMILLVIAVAISIMAVQRVTIGYVAVTAISWSFVLLIQLLIALLLVMSVPSRPISVSRALDLWFAGHVPYSLWLLVISAVVANLESAAVEMVIVLSLIPSLWTSAILSAFCRVVLGTSRRGAWLRAVLQFIVAWAIGLEYVALASGGWFQVVGPVTRFFE